jgi:hypothetical protein
MSFTVYVSKFANMKVKREFIFLANIAKIVAIITKVMNSNLDDGEVYSMQHYAIKFVQ